VKADRAVIKTTCKSCHGGCGVLVSLKNGRIDPRVVVAQASWWYPEDPAPEHGLWKSNANVLTSNDPPYDPAMGLTTFRALLCKISRAKDG
jgi:anaerobic selenocysteine-containing dehydrogenase